MYINLSVIPLSLKIPDIFSLLYYRDRYAGKRHLEALHFPTKGAYTCDKCDSKFNTKRALDDHTRNKCHRAMPSFYPVVQHNT